MPKTMHRTINTRNMRREEEKRRAELEELEEKRAKLVAKTREEYINLFKEEYKMSRRKQQEGGKRIETQEKNKISGRKIQWWAMSKFLEDMTGEALPSVIHIQRETDAERAAQQSPHSSHEAAGSLVHGNEDEIDPECKSHKSTIDVLSEFKVEYNTINSRWSELAAARLSNPQSDPNTIDQIGKSVGQVLKSYRHLIDTDCFDFSTELKETEDKRAKLVEEFWEEYPKVFLETHKKMLRQTVRQKDREWTQRYLFLNRRCEYWAMTKFFNETIGKTLPSVIDVEDVGRKEVNAELSDLQSLNSSHQAAVSQMYGKQNDPEFKSLYKQTIDFLTRFTVEYSTIISDLTDLADAQLDRSDPSTIGAIKTLVDQVRESYLQLFRALKHTPHLPEDYLVNVDEPKEILSSLPTLMGSASERSSARTSG